jgi:hypothetical protein
MRYAQVENAERSSNEEKFLTIAIIAFWVASSASDSLLKIRQQTARIIE